MITLVRRIATVCAYGAVLAACGAPHSLGRPSVPSSVAPWTAVSRMPLPGPAAPGLTPVFMNARTQKKTVALTFDADMTADDGPRAAHGEHFDNPALIEALRELKVPATLFMTGRWADQYPGEARDIGGDPLFEVANHSYSHYSFTDSCYGLPVLPPAKMRADVQRAFTAMRKAGVARPMSYFRFPGGCYDNRALRALGPLGITAIQWDVVSGDALAADAGAVARRVLRGVRPGSVVIMHCTRSAAPVTEPAVRKLVPQLRKQGYRFVKVSELVGVPGGHR
ncbi:polysaccharide deacetylase family protein [Streptomyces gibsoniae]|uniref:Polysaccharide deacetylase family protein n=1 Tax=Streptomyces gibsoniae TaxID=3075529 RepID=A0ABU2U511_9ACTN|nr:polysaccharide deacetylase family protein [Streptomyces sp. DSM 41699]MDT0468307.1 polysaccharide deacetylase family protein [Streptomyces sp. DSM 41699]